MKQCSGVFEKAFDSHCGGCVRTCSCGRTHFDSVNFYDWDERELDQLLLKAKAEPDSFIAHDHSIGTMEIGGKEIVIDCPCDLAWKYEEFIIAHAVQLANYLRLRAIELRERADKIDVGVG